MEQLKEMFEGFRKFMMRGNVIDLAIAVVIGGAFGQVVKALVADIITPIVAMIFGKPDFGGLSFTINNSNFLYGDLINNIITFVSIAAAIYFIVVKPMEVLQARRAQPAADLTTRPCPECLSDIPLKATRCAFCTTVVTPAA
ncbi:MAG TPA: large conductance mechanosensitive channel protein MscL [Candidatus Dormibacteraeota bacterium]|jgi:large conductance mechanosensitive channel|nr:large conductance mechanosensitive channel protein MscL [Candidatus Dormibacteraeota bacterium]